MLLLEIGFLLVIRNGINDFLKKMGVKDHKTLDLIIKGNFKNFQEYSDALNLGAKTEKEYKLVKKHNVDHYSKINEFLSEGFPDYNTLLSNKDYGAPNYEEYKKTIIYGAPNYEKGLKVAKSYFPDYNTYLEGKSLHCNNYQEYLLLKKFNTKNRETSKKEYIEELIPKIRKLNEEKHFWSINEIFDLHLDDSYVKIFFSNIVEFLEVLIEKGVIKATINKTKHVLIFDLPSEKEKKSIIEYIDKIRENIPISLNQMSKLTTIEETRLEKLLNYLINENVISGKLLLLEGVFIKRIKPTLQTESERDIIYSCNICKSEGYIPEDELVWCPNCINSFHQSHILEWLKIQGTCPICQENVTDEALIKQKK